MTQRIHSADFIRKEQEEKEEHLAVEISSPAGLQSHINIFKGLFFICKNEIEQRQHHRRSTYEK
jgi:hypothetical protein